MGGSRLKIKFFFFKKKKTNKNISKKMVECLESEGGN